MAMNDLIEEVPRRNMKLDIPTSFLSLSEKYSCIVAGSYLNIKAGDVYNSVLVQFPNGDRLVHDKDIPTQFENRYYTEGDNRRGKNHIGVALCWEMMRTQTDREMPTETRIVAAGSCWWDLPDDSRNDLLRTYNHELNRTVPSRFAVRLGLPVVHASHVGETTGQRNSSNDSLAVRQLIGTTQIVDSRGRVKGELESKDGNSILVQTVELPDSNRKMDIVSSDFWAIDLPTQYIEAWEKEREIGREYYRKNRLRMIGDTAT